MPYLVDGHNLIPHVPGITLGDTEDEQALIRLLQDFARQQRTRIEVFFDQAPPSRTGSETFGRVKAHFVRQGITADQAIISRLKQMEKEAKNWTVVSSDREILAEVRGLRGKTLSAGTFAGQLSKIKGESAPELDKGEDPEISSQDVDYWLDQFQQG